MARGRHLAANGDLDTAIGNFGKVIRLKPRMVGPYVQRGGVFRERGAHDKALDDFALAIRNAPMQAGPYVERAQSHEKLGRLPEALDDFRIARGLDPQMPAANEGYARVEAAFAASGRPKPSGKSLSSVRKGPRYCVPRNSIIGINLGRRSGEIAWQ
ncbi:MULTISPECIES: tetratricopeptide repeat protein [unclassified Bradyrhizobium]|uniref:tetratricopeptide repeat protein n=1 Tax=unclassified Bradyrhizobium TaxID=2631580 RepID=UPI002FEEBDB7